jgi:hypothetical protein
MLVKWITSLQLRNRIFDAIISTVCFTDLGKLNLIMVVRFLSLNQFLLLPQLPQKVELTSKVVKVDSKIIFLLPEIKIR